jgi:hypothetical protein
MVGKSGRRVDLKKCMKGTKMLLKKGVKKLTSSINRIMSKSTSFLVNE